VEYLCAKQVELARDMVFALCLKLETETQILIPNGVQVALERYDVRLRW
jgi:hypothetical protein